MLQTKPFHSKRRTNESCMLNSRYPSLNHRILHFKIAGDKEQFLSEALVLEHNEEKLKSLQNNFHHDGIIKRKSYDSVYDTFCYLFDKYKKGVYIHMHNNEMKRFLPFSKQNYVNSWYPYTKVECFRKNTSYKDDPIPNLIEMMREINKETKYENSAIHIQRNPCEWVGNNGLCRTEYPYQENETGLNILHDMFFCLSLEREIPDSIVFLNKRDFPLLRKDGHEAFTNFYGDNFPMEKEYQEKIMDYLPILSMNSNDQMKDVAIPTWEEWRLFQYWKEKKIFVTGKTNSYETYPEKKDLNINWDSKRNTAVFRGSSTGLGVYETNNPRLFYCLLSSASKINQEKKYIDARISSFNLRPRKIKGDFYIRTIDKFKYKNLLGEYMSPVEQSNFKYILHLPGHTCAYRLTLELYYGSLLLIFPSEYNLWYFHRLIPGKHYILIEKPYDEEYIFNLLEWCRTHDEECKRIAENGRAFAEEHLTRETILDYLQSVFISCSIQNHITIKSDDYHTKIDNQNQLYRKEINLYHQQRYSEKESFMMNDLYWGNSLLSPIYIHNLFYYLDTCGKLEWFLANKCSCCELFQNKNSTLQLFRFRNLQFVRKRSHGIKAKEHEAFIGYLCVNRLRETYEDNFVHTYYHSVTNKDENETDLYIEYKDGMKLLDWIKVNKLSLENLITIWIYIFCLIQTAQDLFGFIHMDLLPWNILVKEENEQKNIIMEQFNIEIKTKFIPTIIDYEKSFFFFKKQFLNNTEPCSIHPLVDPLFLVFKTLDIFLERIQHDPYVESVHHSIRENKKEHLVIVHNTLDEVRKILSFFETILLKTNHQHLLIKYSVYDYTYESWSIIDRDLNQMKTFFKLYSKYCHLIDIAKYCPQKLKPIHFIHHLIKTLFPKDVSLVKKKRSNPLLFVKRLNNPCLALLLNIENYTSFINRNHHHIIQVGDTSNVMKRCLKLLSKYIALVQSLGESNSTPYYCFSFFEYDFHQAFLHLQASLQKGLQVHLKIDSIFTNQKLYPQFVEPPLNDKKAKGKKRNYPKYIIKNVLSSASKVSNYETNDEKESEVELRVVLSYNNDNDNHHQVYKLF